MRNQLVESKAKGGEPVEEDAEAAARERMRRRRIEWARRSPGIVTAYLCPAPQPGTQVMAEPRRRSEVCAAPSLDGPEWWVDAAAVERHRVVRGWSRRRRPNLGTVQGVCTALGLTLADVIRFY